MSGRILLSVTLLIATVVVGVCKTQPSAPVVNEPPAQRSPEPADIGNHVFGYQTYEEIRRKFEEWESKSPNLIEVGTYGSKSAAGDHIYIRVSNEFAPSNKVVLITACIHGNEPLSTSTVIAALGEMISQYGNNEEMTNLINSRTVYVIPVVSPASYPNSRSSDGVDPNRNFPTLKDPDKKSVPSVANLRDFFLDTKPDAVLSGHTYGRIFLIPWGDNTKDNPNLSDYERIAKKMAELSGYRYQRACEMYNSPIYGTEIDWFHRNGAFAMVMEFGSHQRKPTESETASEFKKTFGSIIHFIKEAPEVDIKEDA